MKRIIPALLFTLLIITAGCEQAHKDMQESTGNMKLSDAQSTEEAPALDRKLIKRGTVAYESGDILMAEKQIKRAVSKHNAYIASEDKYKSSGKIRLSLEIRIPASRFDVFLEDATNGVNDFDKKEINVEDVTEQFLDLEARIKAKKRVESRYLDLLEKAKTIKEILEVESQLETLRSEIESMEGRMKYMSSQIAFSTLHLDVYQEDPEASAFADDLSDGLGTGLNILRSLFIFTLTIWPLWLIAGLVYFGFRLMKRKRKANP